MLRCTLGIALTLGAGCGGRLASPPVTGDTDQVQPALAAAQDAAGHVWMIAGYTDVATPGGSSMGLSVRGPDGSWSALAPLTPAAGAFRPSGDAWLAAAQRGSRVYYVSLLQTGPHPAGGDEVADGLALATIDVASGQPRVSPPRRIDPGLWPQWDEPTVAATRPPGMAADTVLVAGTPIGPDLQDAVGVLVSRDGGATFEAPALLHAPAYPGHVPRSPQNTVVRPVLQQDPRPGQECHALLAFGVYYATALGTTAGVASPTCLDESSGCRSIAETETLDCGRTWAAPALIAVDTGAPSGEDFRGFSYAVAGDGTRLVMFGDDDADDAPILLKRAAPGATFPVVQGGRWQDGAVEVVARGPGVAGPVIRWRPTLAAASPVTALWIEEDAATHASALWRSTSASSGWTPPQRVADAGVACDGLALPSDDYLAAAPEAPFGVASSGLVIGWAPFVPCGSAQPRRLRFTSLR